MEVNEGTWLRLARFRVRVDGSEGFAGSRFAAAAPEDRLFLFVDLPDFDLEEAPVLLVSGRDAAPALFLLMADFGRWEASSPLRREDITLGAAASV